MIHFSLVKAFQEANDVVKQPGPCSQKSITELKQKLYAANRNAKKKLKRREAVIAQQSTCITKQHELIKSHECKLKRAEHQVDQLRAKLKRVNHRALYWKKRVAEITVQQTKTKKAHLHTIDKLKTKLYSLEADNVDMTQTIESLIEDTKVQTFEDGRYTNDVRACIYELLSLNVAVWNIAPIINCVLQN